MVKVVEKFHRHSNNTINTLLIFQELKELKLKLLQMEKFLKYIMILLVIRIKDVVMAVLYKPMIIIKIHTVILRTPT
ncbi:MAG: hypothetical protein A2V67_00300 [Deltaproteobacteria bacterium RBG_13_61_14]|nr:MAG: hypothetical protein A2V67_00300 [Deltaproteobacteria bacterium RBG_13_61_14]